MRPPNCLFVMMLIVAVAVEVEGVVVAAEGVVVAAEGIAAAARLADVPVVFVPPVTASVLPSS